MIKSKFTFVLWIGLVISTLLTGCSVKKEQKVQQVRNNAEIYNELETSIKLPLTAKMTTMTWGSADNFYAPASLNTELEVWKEIEKKTNVRVKWEVAPRSQYEAEMQLKFASGTNLPDFLVVPNFDPTQYGQTGGLLPLEDLVEKYAPNIQHVFKVYPGAKELMTSADGHIYGLASIIEGSADTFPQTFTIRKDWLSKLGLKEPNTIEEWYKVLKAFKEKDPNGNGLKDEIPFGSAPFYFSEAFGLQLMSGSDFKEENGKVLYQWSDPRMKEYLLFASKLYKEGLLDPDFGVETCESTKLKVVKGRMGSYVNYPDWINSWEKLLQGKGEKDSQYIPILPPLGDKGQRSLDSSVVIDKSFSGISKNCKDPILAIKLLDYLWSEEGIRYMAWGIKGKTYVIKDGQYNFTEFITNNKDGLGMSDALRSVGAWPTIPWVQQSEQYIQILSLNTNFKNFQEIIKPILKETFPMLLANKLEQERLTILENNVTSYKDEMMIKFIIGKESIENFNKYVEMLKSMGVKELISIKQKQYDRYKKQGKM